MTRDQNCLLRALLLALLFSVPAGLRCQIATAALDQAESNQPSAYVPLDLWVYPAFERLNALGYLPSAFLGMRPWTRSECLRLLHETATLLETDERAPREARYLYAALQQEFSSEARGSLNYQLESLYFRYLGISGPPLRDGYHFAQTITNDYGRPFAERSNFIAGVAARGSAGPLAVYVRGEFQHWASSPAVPGTVSQAIAAADNRPVLPGSNHGANRFRLLDSFVALQFHDVQVSFGKQSLWLGPGPSGPFLFSNNAEPIWMLQINRISPWEIPWVVRVLGSMRWQLFFGQLAGHQFVFSEANVYGPSIRPQPFIHGEKVSFHPTENLQFGMGVTTVFGGPGMPLTAGNFLRTLSWWNYADGASEDTGDHRSAFDFSYRVPRLRRWLVVYGDALVEDEISPIGSSRPAFHPGIYLPQIPGMAKLDLRLEGVYSDVPGQRPIGTIYYNSRYRSGYTNYGNLLANWIGRQGRGGEASATYWFTPRNRLQLGYRHMEVDRAFLHGGHLNDFRVSSEARLSPDVVFSSAVQYERWAFPLLAARARSNTSVILQLMFTPRPGE